MGALFGKKEGASGSHSSAAAKPSSGGGFFAIPDKYKTLEQVQQGLRDAGLESSNLIIGIDYTKSNTWTGKASFGGKCLHALSPGAMNPYQRVIDIIGRTLEPFDDDKLIPVFGFGDVTTTDRGVFPFFPDNRPCNGFGEVLTRYNEITPNVVMSGPTNFAPLIDRAAQIAMENRQYHILIIIADGQVTNEDATAQAIIRASKTAPLSICTIGVGDGPWELMEEFDDKLPERQFDNFQFVPFNEIMNKPNVENYDVEFAIAALQEIPDQYNAIKKCKLLG
ncbi:calcium-dependent phospholipid-binding protein family protein [Pelomyxa schiedti]|nr:calcium-dependent phospholipid-binding protein family protein [Pelomyxa schiedti]